MIRSGIVVLVVAIAGVAIALLDSVPVAIAIVAWALSGVGMGLAYSGVQLTVLQNTEEGREGVATSSMQIGFVTGTAFGAGMGGVVLSLSNESRDGIRFALATQFSIMATLLLIALVGVSRLRS